MIADSCIYCTKSSPDQFSGREHVIPQAFGTFGSQTPTLHSVCDECNAYFSRRLDQVLARDTLEGVTRYRKNNFSSENRPQKRLRFTLAEGDETGDFGGVVVSGVNPTTGEVLPIVAQLHIKNRTTGKTNIFLRGLGPVVISDSEYGESGKRELFILAPSKDLHDQFAEELMQMGIILRLGEPLALPKVLQNEEGAERFSLPVHIEGEVDDIHKRALAKILINFAAKYVGADVVMAPEWTAIKRYVRHGEGLLGARFSHKPFWGQETDEMRFPSDSINIRIENHARGIVGAIQFYNNPTYELLLIEGVYLAPEKHAAYRFTPGTEPQKARRGPSEF